MQEQSTESRTRVFGPLLLALAGMLVLPWVGRAEGGGGMQRTVSGHPDLSGTYDVATLTPLVRPPQLADKQTLTDAEAAALADHWRESFAKDFERSDPNREAPPKGGVEFYAREFNGAAGGVGGYNAFFIDLGNSAFKVDGKWRTSIIVDPPNGQMPPLTEQAERRAATEESDFRHQNTGTAWWLDLPAGPYDDPELRPLGERCLLGFGSTSGPPALPVMYNNMKRIVQTEDAVMILAEMDHDARVVRMNAEHEPATLRKWMGDSVGRWEGETLVIDTVNFRDQPALRMASKDLHVIERISRIDDHTLLYRFTVDDPSTWVRPWTGEYVWPVSDDRLYEYACHEGNYALGGILRGARLLEQEKRSESGDSGRER